MSCYTAAILVIDCRPADGYATRIPAVTSARLPFWVSIDRYQYSGFMLRNISLVGWSQGRVARVSTNNAFTGLRLQQYMSLP